MTRLTELHRINHKIKQSDRVISSKYQCIKTAEKTKTKKQTKIPSLCIALCSALTRLNFIPFSSEENMSTSPTPYADEKFKTGSAVFEGVTGQSAQAFVTAFDDVAPGFGRYIIEWEFGDLYSRPGLDLRYREVAIIASCATLGVIGHAALKMHILVALRAGLTKNEIGEILMQVAFAAGLPTAIGAIGVAREAFSEFSV
ncbi:carboxymuconolactone decarboxylase family protein [Herbaspirillum huttiense]|uniref:carboxymuconolactone decarboxylase family protein n=2 Tax=Oxalobacteraceae TaxID=75682 RepID=UPI001E58112D|nr:carboxymuconolactone decarboxylase family protein [Herbaspirillum huttiense]